jgi:ATP-dependent Clp protease ATP-binding subunit ClpA
MFERFTDRARRVVVLAQEEARMLNHSYIGTEHLLLGLISEGEGVGAKALESLGVELVKARGAIEGIIGKGGGAVPEGHIPFTPRAKHVLEFALRESLQLGHNYIGTEHVLLGLLREEEGVGAQVLARAGVTIDEVRMKVIQLLQGHGTVGPPRQRLVDAAMERFDRFSPGLRAAIEAAAGHATGAAAIGTHHLLAVFAEWDDLAAHAALVAGGFDASSLLQSLDEWDVAGTRDETPEEWGERVTEVSTEGDTVVIRITDPAVRAAVEANPDLRGSLGVAFRDLAGPASAPPSGTEDGD